MFGYLYYGLVPCAVVYALTNESVGPNQRDGGGWAVKGYRTAPRKAPANPLGDLPSLPSLPTLRTQLPKLPTLRGL